MVVGTGWRRWIWLCAFLLVSLWTFTYIRSLKTEIEVLNSRLDKSLKTSDSLATQLQVVNTHKEKIEQFLESAKKTNQEKLQELKHENRQLKEKLDTCNKSTKDSPGSSTAVLTKHAKQTNQ
ncbi:hypothetical protein DdX_11058 [Ditylenchus destructor]|uniref:Uncharacterized protein n=1 Tax=Ditylenchus destructor TaxID=166010 RepID=A0AAD4MXV0_9BILA|nr:hypothetical protein DdX_11058 [Ditylenchus destructor]